MRTLVLIGSLSWALLAHAQTGPGSVNVAAATRGGVATASSTYNASFPASAANNGDRKGVGWGAGGGWSDGTGAAYPDWLQVTFSGTKTIGEIDVFTLQDNYGAPADPTLTMTFAQYGITAFEVQYWNGSAWVDVPGGSVTGNNHVWRRFTFASVSTDRVRVLVNAALASFSRIVEVEAWTATVTVDLTAPAGNTMLAAPATVDLSAAAADGSGTLGRVEFYRDATLIATVTTPSSGTTTSGTYTASDTGVPPGSYTYTAKAYDSVDSTMVKTSAGVPVSVTGIVAGSVNVAASANGGVASASSSAGAGYPASGAIDGDRKGLGWGSGGGWSDGTANVFPDWLEVDFAGPKSVGEIDVFTLQDNPASPVDPTSGLTFTQSGLTAFEVQYWTGSAWADVPGGNVTGNGYVWRRFGFSPVVTERIRVLANAGAGGSSRIVELEAWSAPHYEISGTVSTNGAPAAGVALAADNGARCASSNASGQYVCTVLPGWSGTVTPSSPSYNFTPASRSYTSVAADQAGQDYAGAQYVSISGTITSNGAPLAGVPVVASGASCTSSDASGHYSCTVPKSWSGSVAPLGGYSYTPMSRSYQTVTADQAAQDYAGVASTVAISYVQVDHLNTPRAVSNASGTPVWRWDQTEPFGDSVPNGNPAGLGTFEHPLRFAGQYADRETNLNYNYFRDYDPGSGRYVKSDPIGLIGGINTYAYTLNDPLLHVDPLGLARTTVDSAIQNAAARGDINELRTLAEAAMSDEERAAAEKAISRLTSKAEELIAKECKGSVNREFPGQFRQSTLEEIIQANRAGDGAARKALKLLTDPRFKK